MKEMLYYIVGVSLLVLLVLVVYVGSRVQTVEMGLSNVDSRLSAIEAQFNMAADTMGYYDPSIDDLYGASAYDTLMGGSYGDGSEYYVPYDYATY